MAIAISLSLFLTWASLAVVSVPWIFEHEELLIGQPLKIKKWLNKTICKDRFFDTSFLRQRLLVINTTNDQELVSAPKALPRTADAGTPITDRKKLARLFKMLNNAHTSFDLIVCDVFFEVPSDHKNWDDSLNKYLNELQLKRKIVFGVPYDKRSEQFEPCRFSGMDPLNMGATNKEPVSEFYIRHRLTYDKGNVKSLPFLLYERTNHHDFHPTLVPGLLSCNSTGTLLYNSFIPEMIFDREDLDQADEESRGRYDSSAVICDLGIAVSDTSDIYIRSLLNAKGPQKKDIFIGAIRGRHADKHRTLYGTLDGIIILFNTYYCIELGQNKFDPLQIGISFVVFLFISYHIVYGKRKEIKGRITFFTFVLLKLRRRLYYLVLLMLTFISFFWFNHSTNLLALIVLIEGINFVVRLARNYRLVRIGSHSFSEEQ
jgi:hypothetical protein